MVSKGKTKKKTNETIKRELLNLSKENDDVEKQGLNETVNNVNNSQEAIFAICRYQDIIKTQNKKAIAYIAKQRQFLKRFKGTQNFFDNVGQSKSTMYFKNSLYEFLEKYALLKISTLQSSYFKNNFKAIKVVCKENPTLFV